jgi:hypothetical protein
MTSDVGEATQRTWRRPKVRRRWLAAAVCLVVVLLSIRALDRDTRIDYYRVLDPQTIGVETTGGEGSWTRITSVVETSSSMTIEVSSLSVPFLPGTTDGSFLELGVRLSQPLGTREVIDGSRGDTLTVAPSPWPPQLGNP